MAKKTLIATLPPMVAGGVTAKAGILASALRDAGHDVTVAFYDLPHAARFAPTIFGGARAVAVPSLGRWLEQRYTDHSPVWQELIDSHDRHVAVGGTVLIANPLAVAGLRHLVWCAADLAGDRGHRWRAMPWWRQAGDAMLVSPALMRQQQRVLAADNTIHGVSTDTVDRLSAQVTVRVKKIRRLPIPVNTEFFTPDTPGGGGCRLGFAGRLDDPRKNAELLFETFAQVRLRDPAAKLMLTGAPTRKLAAMAARLGIEAAVTFAGELSPDALRRFYQDLDVFVIASHQEGLAIAGLEAMACGVPVVSTRCGGPADYVVDDVSGRLCDFNALDMAEAVLEIADPETRPKFSEAARRTVEETYSFAGFGRNLARAWRGTWSESP